MNKLYYLYKVLYEYLFDIKENTIHIGIKSILMSKYMKNVRRKVVICRKWCLNYHGSRSTLFDIF